MSEPTIPPASPLPPPQPPTMRPPPPRKSNGPWIGCLIAFLVVLAIIAVFGLIFLGLVGTVASKAPDAMFRATATPTRHVTRTYEHVGARDQVIAVIPVYGVIHSGPSGRLSINSGQLIDYLREARDQEVDAVILDLNTPGGEMTATDEVHHELLKLREDGIVTVSCMRSIAASGGYYLAAGTDYIVANRLTFTGSIGVIMGGYNYHGLLEKLAVEPEVYKSGELKDFLSMGRVRQEHEAQLIQSMIDEAFNEFATIVAAGRPDLTLEQVKTGPIGDAGVFSGARAFELGLVDELGYMEDAIAYAKTAAGLQNPSVIRYGQAPSLKDVLFGAGAEQTDLADLLTPFRGVIQPGRLYFLCPVGLE